MFFGNSKTENRQLPETVSNMQTDVQNWFTGTPVGQTVNSWQNTAQQYQQNMNDWFSQIPIGQDINQVNSVYDQQLQQLHQDEQTRNAANRAAQYDRFLKQLGL